MNFGREVTQTYMCVSVIKIGNQILSSYYVSQRILVGNGLLAAHERHIHNAEFRYVGKIVYSLF